MPGEIPAFLRWVMSTQDFCRKIVPAYTGETLQVKVTGKASPED